MAARPGEGPAPATKWREWRGLRVGDPEPSSERVAPPPRPRPRRTRTVREDGRARDCPKRWSPAPLDPWEALQRQKQCPCHPRSAFQFCMGLGCGGVFKIFFTTICILSVWTCEQLTSQSHYCTYFLCDFHLSECFWVQRKLRKQHKTYWNNPFHFSIDFTTPWCGELHPC